MKANWRLEERQEKIDEKSKCGYMWKEEARCDRK
jgi:hypothetical protein